MKISFYFPLAPSTIEVCTALSEKKKKKRDYTVPRCWELTTASCLRRHKGSWLRELLTSKERHEWQTENSLLVTSGLQKHKYRRTASEHSWAKQLQRGTAELHQFSAPLGSAKRTVLTICVVRPALYLLVQLFPPLRISTSRTLLIRLPSILYIPK